MTHPFRQIVLFAALSVAAVRFCSAEVAEAAHPKNGEIIPPTVVYRVDPQHPPELFNRAIEGEAVVITTVDVFGTAINPIVERSTHQEFGLAAALAASEWIFEPATRNGVPIELKVRIPFEFKIAFEHRLNVELKRDVYRAIDAPITASSELEAAPQPRYIPALVDFYPSKFSGTGKSAAISLEFVIDPEGNVVNPQVITASAPGFEESAIRAVSQFKFKPISKGGQPAYISMMMPIQLTE